MGQEMSALGGMRRGWNLVGLDGWGRWEGEDRMRLNRKDGHDGVEWDEIIEMELDHLNLMLSLLTSRV